MTIDERIQFLVQSTESLHSNGQEQAARMEVLGTRMEVLGTRIEGLTVKVEGIAASVAALHRVVEIDADNIRRLANIAAAHSDGMEDLSARLDRLERKRKENN